MRRHEPDLAGRRQHFPGALTRMLEEVTVSAPIPRLPSGPVRESITYVNSPFTTGAGSRSVLRGSPPSRGQLSEGLPALRPAAVRDGAQQHGAEANLERQADDLHQGRVETRQLLGGVSNGDSDIVYAGARAPDTDSW